jgi:hypothetical protein
MYLYYILWFNGLGTYSAYVTELWSVLEGLKLAGPYVIIKLEFHIDSMFCSFF